MQIWIEVMKMTNKSKSTWRFAQFVFLAIVLPIMDMTFTTLIVLYALQSPFSNLAKTQLIIIILIISITSLVWGTYHDLKKAGFIKKNK